MEPSKIKVVLTSIFYPVFMGRYIWEALLNRADVEVTSVGPYSENWIPWGGGMELPSHYARKPTMPIPFKGAVPYIDYEEIDRKLDFNPDLWLEVNAGLPTRHKPKGKYAVIGTDPHVLDYTVQRNQAHYFFCMQRPYMHHGDIWLPYAHDKIWHDRTQIPFEDREFDVSLIGLHYSTRNDLFNALMREGFRTHYSLGEAYMDAQQIYHRTRIGVNWSSQRDMTARVFEIMGFGIVPVLNRVPDLSIFFNEGEHYLGFETLDEAVEKIKWALGDGKEEAKQIAQNARNAVKEAHTWDKRVATILEETGLLARPLHPPSE